MFSAARGASTISFALRHGQNEPQSRASATTVCSSRAIVPVDTNLGGVSGSPEALAGRKQNI